MTAPSLLPPDLVAMMARGVSVNVSSRDAAMRPSVMRAMGSEVLDEGRTITVFVSRLQAAQLLQDVAATGHVAVVFSEPVTHRTVQVKATRAALRDAQAADEPALARYLASMELEIQLVGHPPHVTRAMLAHRIEDLVAITFEPELAYEQTPGMKAGTSLAGSRRR